MKLEVAFLTTRSHSRRYQQGVVLPATAIFCSAVRESASDMIIVSLSSLSLHVFMHPQNVLKHSHTLPCSDSTTAQNMEDVLLREKYSYIITRTLYGYHSRSFSHMCRHVTFAVETAPLNKPRISRLQTNRCIIWTFVLHCM